MIDINKASVIFSLKNNPNKLITCLFLNHEKLN